MGARGLALAALLVAAGGAAQAAPDGRALVEKYQCARCHDGLPAAPVADGKHCVRCHRRVLDGRLEVEPARLRSYQAHLRSLNAAPSLAGIGARLRRDFVRALLADTLPLREFRPSLPATMPRLAIAPDEADALAALLVPEDAADPPSPPPTPSTLTAGEALWRRAQCGRCHRMTGASIDGPLPASTGRVPDGVALAPDLARTRERMRPAVVARFLVDPQAFAPESAMPRPQLTPAEADTLAAYLLGAPLTRTTTSPPPLLPLLRRKVGFAEVSARVFRKVCWHCHSQPDYALGDGGPGNTGGFGFAARGLDLSSYAGVSSGARGDDGQRRSIFRVTDGEPELVRRLVARQREEAGRPDPGTRGMPLGFPALSAEELQLVRSWIAQGRPE